MSGYSWVAKGEYPYQFPYKGLYGKTLCQWLQELRAKKYNEKLIYHTIMNHQQTRTFFHYRPDLLEQFKANLRISIRSRKSESKGGKET